jgi:hypothetical protein
MANLQVAQTILSQLGGNRFTAMTGAKNFAGDDNSLTFRLPSNGFCKDSINCVKITLTPMDVYTMEFMRVRGVKVKKVSTFDMVYCDQLQSIFSHATGLLTRL